MIRHAGLIALHDQAGWRGVLIEGPSGAGKSDLAIRALDQGFRLVADDRVLVWTSRGRLFGRAPDALRDLIEARGLGVLPEPALPFCEIALIVRCGAAERVPEARAEDLVGVTLPVVILDPREPSAPAKLRRALDAFDAGRKRRI
ncbi:HPr kinase/phosphorylase [Phenylobacterium sp.]|uniref:HPr kinase/phosphorylase n=1 Tax=Phenylobacterium sp. TaxID=1871053 RepID=UPI0039831035